MSADKILDKIIADANAEAEATLERAKAEARQRVSGAGAEAAADVARIEQKAAADAAETERRRMLGASLDARKNTLAERRELMERAFSEALDRFLKLPDDDYNALVAKIVAAASETGAEAVVVPESDEKRYKSGKMLDALNAALKAAGKPAKLTYGGTTTAFSGGVLLKGEITDIDCSFESLIAQFREDREMEVARILFGSEV